MKQQIEFVDIDGEPCDDPYTDDIDKWVGRLLSFLCGVGFLFTCFALGLWGVK